MALTDNLIAAYKLDDTADSYGSFTLTNNGTVTFTTGKSGNGATITSAGQYLSTANDLGLTATEDFSISMWVKLASETTVDRDIFNISHNGATGTETRLVYEYNGGTRRLRAYRNPQLSFADRSGNIADNAWHNIIVTMTNSASGVKLYFDDGAAATGSSTSTTNITNSDQFTLGSTVQYSHTAPINGMVDEVMVWNKILSSTERTELQTTFVADVVGGAAVNGGLLLMGVG